MLQSSHVLARLPNPIGTRTAKPLAADVYALAVGKKKKRPEVALAVDFEGISLYDVCFPGSSDSAFSDQLLQIQSSRLITSYSISPQAAFTCPPCSVRQKTLKAPPRRLTYCSVIDPKPRLQCFVEEAGKRHDTNGKISSTSCQITHNQSPIVFLETINNPESGSQLADPVLIAVHEDGEVRCYSTDLAAELWRSSLIYATDGSQERTKKVCYSALIQDEEARKGLLRNREDILAILQGSIGQHTLNSPPTEVLLLVTQTTESDASDENERLQLSMFNLSNNNNNNNNNNTHAAAAKQSQKLRKLTQLVSFQIPLPDERRGTKRLYYIHKRSGSFYHCAGKVLRIFDLTSLVPRLVQQIQWKGTIHSFLRLSSSSLVLASRKSISILDTRYQSILALMPITPIHDDMNGTGNEKKSGSVGKDYMELFSYFATQAVAIAIHGQALLSIQIGDGESGATAGRKRSRNGLLINAIGKGMRSSKAISSSKDPTTSISKSFGLFIADEVDPSWETIKTQLGVLVSDGDIANFDSTIDVAFGGIDIKNEPFSTKWQRPPRSKLVYIISKIFTVKDLNSPESTSPNRSHLTVSFLPPKTFSWLAFNGLLSLPFVESALKESGSLLPASELDSCAVLHALVIFDTSLRALQTLLSSPSSMTTREVAFAVRYSISALRQQSSPAYQHLITNKEVKSEEAHSDTEILEANASTNRESDSGQPSDLSQVAHRILQECLARLRYYHEPDTRKAFKQELSRENLLSFIDFLRVSIARGGWLSLYMDNGFVPITEQQLGDDQLSILIKLLSCAVDCLGTGGWITGRSNVNMVDNSDTLAYMKAEVSAALEGIEEAAYLKAMLKDVLLYSKSLATQHTIADADALSKAKPITVSVESWEDNVLPIGLKADQGVGLTKVGAGGEIQARSMRDVGRLKSRKIGPYSFERIII